MKVVEVAGKWPEPDRLARKLAETPAVIVSRGAPLEKWPLVKEELRRLGVDWTRIALVDAELDTYSTGLGVDELVELWGSVLGAARAPAVSLNVGKRLTRRELISLGASVVLEYTGLPSIDAACAKRPSCTLCIEACPYGALKGKPPSPDPGRCLECGLCASACPAGLVAYPPLSWNTLRTALEEASRRGVGRVTVTCPHSRPSLYSGSPGLVVEAPCIVAVHPGARLYAEALGLEFSEYCDSEAYARCPLKTARDIHLSTLRQLGEAVEPGPLGASAGHGDPRRLLTSARPRRSGWAELPLPLFFKVAVDGGCTLCGVCVERCPEEALRISIEGDKYRLYFSHAGCTGCGLCVDACPEGAISLSWSLNPSMLGRWIPVAESEVARCRVCGRPIGPEAEVRRIEEALERSGAPRWVVESVRLCPGCKARRSMGL